MLGLTSLEASGQEPPSVVCVVLNWNGWHDTITCLAALARLHYPKLSVLVVDNGSTDESIPRIRAAYPTLPLLETGRNLGFGGGVNIGIRRALQERADFVWLLNNDAEPAPAALSQLIGKALSDPRLGAVGSVLSYSDQPSRVQAWGGGKINRWIGTARHATSSHPDKWFNYITGASMLLRREALEEVGLFDERFFLYWEDGDVCFRLLAAGWQLGVASLSAILHRENASTGGNRSRVDRFSTASGIHFLGKHSPLPWLSIPLFLTLRVARRLLTGRLGCIRDVTGGVLDYLANRRVSGGFATVPQSKVVVYAAFKGMGDLICAAPVIKSELDAGVQVHLLIFPQVRPLVDLLDFGASSTRLFTHVLPVGNDGPSPRQFLRDMARLSPQLVWYSPHAPRVVSSWRLPLLLWFVKKRYWPQAKLVGADSERVSQLFDIRVPVDRTLPYAEREWTGYSMLRRDRSATAPPVISFKAALQQLRQLPPAYDLLIHPGAGSDNRKWPWLHYAELLKNLPTRYRIAVLGLPEDVAAMRAVLSDDPRVEFLTGNFEQALAAIARARIALTMDSGTMFFAKALGVPAVSLFGPSNPGNVIAQGGTITPLYEQKWPCQPCQNLRCRQDALYCMDSISPHRVAQTLLRLLHSAA